MYIYGEKILFRAIEGRDTGLLRGLINDPDTEKMVFGASWPVSESDQQRWIAELRPRADMLRCIVEDRTTGEALGTVILSDIDQRNGTAELHIKLAAAARGKGYGTDCVRTAVGYAFRVLRLNCVYANILSYNTASRKLFERCGFTLDGILRSRVYKDGQYVDACAYSILRGEEAKL